MRINAALYPLGSAPSPPNTSLMTMPYRLSVFSCVPRCVRIQSQKPDNSAGTTAFSSAGGADVTTARSRRCSTSARAPARTRTLSYLDNRSGLRHRHLPRWTANPPSTLSCSCSRDLPWSWFQWLKWAAALQPCPQNPVAESLGRQILCQRRKIWTCWGRQKSCERLRPFKVHRDHSLPPLSGHRPAKRSLTIMQSRLASLRLLFR